MSSKRSVSERAFSSIGDLIKLLPTGTVFLFQFLNPVLTNNGHCGPANKYLTTALLAVCAFSCAFSSFTDSYVGDDGFTHYGVATCTGLWPSTSSGSVDLEGYRVRFGDFVHAWFSVVVFAAVSLLDSNTVQCFYPAFLVQQKMVLMILPPVIGAISGSIFMLFPNKRNGIGYPPTPPPSS